MGPATHNGPPAHMPPRAAPVPHPGAGVPPNQAPQTVAPYSPYKRVGAPPHAGPAGPKRGRLVLFIYMIERWFYVIVMMKDLMIGRQCPQPTRTNLKT